MNDKFKNDAPRLNPALFLALWIAGYVAPWILAIGARDLLDPQGNYIGSILRLSMLMALSTGIPTAIIQVLLVEHGLKKSMRGWLPVSVIGWVLSGLAYVLLWQSYPVLYRLLPDEIFAQVPNLMFFPLLVPVALLQWLWLRRKVKWAGLWVIMALVGATGFAVLRGQLYLADMLLYSGSAGLTMYHLWTQQESKAKRGASLAQQSHEDALPRLSRLDDESGENQRSLPDLQTATKMANEVR